MSVKIKYSIVKTNPTLTESTTTFQIDSVELSKDCTQRQLELAILKTVQALAKDLMHGNITEQSMVLNGACYLFTVAYIRVRNKIFETDLDISDTPLNIPHIVDLGGKLGYYFTEWLDYNPKWCFHLDEDGDIDTAYFLGGSEEFNHTPNLWHGKHGRRRLHYINLVYNTFLKENLTFEDL